MQAIVQALAGYYNDAFEKVAATSPFNEVVMLLAMKKNQEAWDKISTMDVETAREYYIKAIAANRMEKVGDAIMSIEKALELDPYWLIFGRGDGPLPKDALNYGVPPQLTAKDEAKQIINSLPSANMDLVVKVLKQFTNV